MVALWSQPFQFRIILADALQQVNRQQGSLGMDGGEGVAVMGLHYFHRKVAKNAKEGFINYLPCV